MMFDTCHNFQITGGNFTQNSYSRSGIDILFDHYLSDATHDSYIRDKNKPSGVPQIYSCYIHSILTWATASDQEQQHRILWVKGPPSTGKTTIAHVCAEDMEGYGLLGASFFFSRINGIVDPARFFTTIAYQLAAHIEEFKPILDERVQHNPAITTKGLGVQLQELIVVPFLELETRHVQVRQRIVLVDGLDECSDSSTQSKIVELIANSIATHGSKVPLLWTFFSRSRRHLDNVFSTESISSLCWQITLPAEDRLEKLKRYLRDALRFPSHLHTRQIHVSSSSGTRTSTTISNTRPSTSVWYQTSPLPLPASKPMSDNLAQKPGYPTTSSFVVQEGQSQVYGSRLNKPSTNLSARVRPALAIVNHAGSQPDDLHNLFYILLREIIEDHAKTTVVIGMKGELAQCMADFLNHALNEGGFSKDERKKLLSLLSKLAQCAGVFPLCKELKGVNCDLTHPLYSGGYGDIYKGEYLGKTVSVKTFRSHGRLNLEQRLLTQAYAREPALWSHLSHPNILPLYGVFQSEEVVTRVCIVSPWISNGNLVNYSERFPNAPRLPLIADTIAGLGYLHDSGIVHADLKGMNILVSDQQRAMLADFGSSRVSTETIGSPDRVSGTLRWMAPELLIQPSALPTVKSDIWAFGCVCYEVYTGKIPFQELANDDLISAFNKNPISPFAVSKASRKIDKGVRKLMELCWEFDPENRPSTDAVQHVITCLMAQASDHSQASAADDYSLSGPAVSSTDVLDYKRIYSVLLQVQRGSDVLQ